MPTIRATLAEIDHSHEDIYGVGDCYADLPEGVEFDLYEDDGTHAFYRVGPDGTLILLGVD